MIQRAMALSVLVSVLLFPLRSEGSGPVVETPDLIVSDATGNLSHEELKRSADRAQATLEEILKFWSADSGAERFGKIRVIFDAPRRDIYSAVFYWEGKEGERNCIVRVHGTEKSPQMMAHKLTSAVFPNKDKLIRNMMGILTEAQVGNPLTFPMCGFVSDDWVSAVGKTGSFLPIAELGPDHESWGMKDGGGGKLLIQDKAKQHKTYAVAGSFAAYLSATYGIDKLKRLHRISHETDRPWQKVYGIGVEKLVANWLDTIRANEKSREGEIATVSKLLAKNPETACAEAQKRFTGKR